MPVRRIEIKPEAVEFEPAGDLGTARPVERALVGGLPAVLMDGSLWVAGCLGLAEQRDLGLRRGGLGSFGGNRVEGFVEAVRLLLRRFCSQRDGIGALICGLLPALRECGQRKQEDRREQQEDDAVSDVAHGPFPFQIDIQCNDTSSWTLEKGIAGR